MRALQVNLQSIPATVFINREEKAVLFVKHGDKNFIDYRDGGSMVAWTKDALCVEDKNYSYNKWQGIEEDSPLKNYFRSVLREPLADLG